MTHKEVDAKTTIRLDEDNAINTKRYKEEYGTPINRIINIALRNFFREKSDKLKTG